MNRFLLYILGILTIAALPSCVHEWPAPPSTRPVQLTITRDKDMDYVYHLVQTANTRAEESGRGDEDGRGVGDGDDPRYAARYHIKAYPKGTTQLCVFDQMLHNHDLDHGSVVTTMQLPAGDFDVYVWNENVDASSHDCIFYTYDDFNEIKNTEPHIGANEYKDAFRGMVTVSVPESVDNVVEIKAQVCLERPLAAFAFVATDLEEFVRLETTRYELAEKERQEQLLRQQQDTRDDSDTRDDDDTKGPDGSLDAPTLIPDYRNYKVTMYYPGFVPTTFNNFTNKPTDSSVGLSYTTAINDLSDEEALIGFDHHMANGHASSVKVGFEVRDPNGNVIASLNPIDIPMERGKCTIVRGAFLTSKAQGGVGINPDFEGDINIEIK